MSTDAYAYEFYPTPRAYVKWLYERLVGGWWPCNAVGLAPCVGGGRIPEIFSDVRWITNDLDPVWPADYHGDAGEPEMWQVWLDANGGQPYDLLVENPAYSVAFPILWNAVHSRAARIIALHVRLSFFEATKSEPSKVDFLANHLPSDILHLPRYPYAKSRKSGKYSQDTVPSCWAIWHLAGAYNAPAVRFHYPPAWVYTEAKAEHRARVAAEEAAHV
jgi:hypothetical protein